VTFETNKIGIEKKENHENNISIFKGILNNI
jgi:hypothetical protein